MILDEFIELWQALLQYFYDYEKYVEIDQNRPRRLQNEALRPPKAPREASWTTKGPLGALRGGFGVVSRRPLGSKKRGTRKMEIDITLFGGSFWHRFGNVR